jgi:hypothetical protein
MPELTGIALIEYSIESNRIMNEILDEIEQKPERKRIGLSDLPRAPAGGTGDHDDPNRLAEPQQTGNEGG